MGRAEADREITNEPKSSRPTRKTTQQAEEKTLLGEWISLLKKCLTGPTLLEMKFWYGTCLGTRVISMGRRNTKLEPTLHRKQKPKSLARARPTRTLLWLGLDRAQPNRWFSRGNIAESMHWMVLHRPVEPAAFTGQVAKS